MLKEAKLPTYFFEEAFNTACYTQNITLINKHGVIGRVGILAKGKI